MDNLSNITQLREEITNKTHEIVNQTISTLFNRIKPVLYIILVLIIILVLYFIIKFFLKIIKERRIKITYINTEKILEKLSELDKKMNIILKTKEKSEKSKAVEKQDKPKADKK